MSNVKEWAKREIELAMTGERFEGKEAIDELYKVALEAFCDLSDKVDQVDKPGLAKTLITQLMHGDPLTPIEDNEEDWVVVEGFDPAVGNENPGWTIYQCKRRNSLFKKVSYDRKTGEEDSVEYNDTERSICYDINTNNAYTGGMGPAVLNKFDPIKMPYQPLGKIRIFTEDFKCHEDYDGDFDTVGVLYFRDPDGEVRQVMKFFKEDYKTKQMVEINKTEYLSRKKKYMERRKKHE